jgi:hypothetical protein
VLSLSCRLGIATDTKVSIKKKYVFNMCFFGDDLYEVSLKNSVNREEFLAVSVVPACIS